MVFQRPNPFPTFSIYDNVAVGLKLNGMRSAPIVDEQRREEPPPGRALGRSERPPRQARHRPVRRAAAAPLHRPALAVEPEILLLDEPCSALDPIATERIEELLGRSAKGLHARHGHPQHPAGRPRRGSHGLPAAGRAGRRRPDGEMFTNPKDSRTEVVHQRAIWLNESCRQFPRTTSGLFFQRVVVHGLTRRIDDPTAVGLAS